MTKLTRLLQSVDCSVTQMADGTAVLLNLRNETLLTLNDTAALMLTGIQEGLDETDIAQRIAARYSVDEATARTDVAEFAQRLIATLDAG